MSLKHWEFAYAPQKVRRVTVLNSAIDDEDFSAPPSEDSAPPLSRREAAKARQVSLKQASDLLGRDRNTIMKWLANGCPYVEKADRDRGMSWILDLGDVVKWLEERAAKNVADRLGGIESQITEDEAKRRIAVAKMIVEETEAAEATKMVAKIHDMLKLVRRDYNELRSRLVTIPDVLPTRSTPRTPKKPEGL